MARSEGLGNVYIRSLSGGGRPAGLGECIADICALLASRGIARILLETVGVRLESFADSRGKVDELFSPVSL